MQRDREFSIGWFTPKCLQEPGLGLLETWNVLAGEWGEATALSQHPLPLRVRVNREPDVEVAWD